MANYTGFLAPKVALGSNIALMVADPAVAAAGSVSRGQPMRRRCCGRLLSDDLPRSRWLAVLLVGDPDRARASRRSCFPAPRR